MRSPKHPSTHSELCYNLHQLSHARTKLPRRTSLLSTLRTTRPLLNFAFFLLPRLALRIDHATTSSYQEKGCQAQCSCYCCTDLPNLITSNPERRDSRVRTFRDSRVELVGRREDEAHVSPICGTNHQEQRWRLIQRLPRRVQLRQSEARGGGRLACKWGSR